MLAKGLKRIASVVGALLVLILLALQLYHRNHSNGNSRLPLSPTHPNSNESPSPPPSDNRWGRQDEDQPQIDMSATHTVLSSVSTPDKKWFHIDFGGRHAINPSIIPHPEQPNTWIITAQLHKPSDQRTSSVWFAELVCDAVFRDDGRTLGCIDPPLILPIAATIGDSNNCVGDLSFFALNVGPHDARVFYGPDAPYTIYGSNSHFTCFGQWIQDLRPLVDWKRPMDLLYDHGFRQATELHRPLPFSAVEKNWFLFWDATGQAYVHYDVSPNRVFAKLDPSGLVGPDLAPLASSTDNICLQHHLPTLKDPEFESIHQATNSLSITLCSRSDLSCHPTDANTFILTIFQHKTFYSFHSVYEPYAMLFSRSPPFAIHSISSKPLWISGRGTPGQGKKPQSLTNQEAESWNQTEMLYVTSISWKDHGNKYHGYIDDVIFLGFGCEDEDTGGVDVVAGDLVRDMELGGCGV
ncbi:uncharacterized protein BDW43DRAFT_285837 [Aspergillus alliaceus]|uniref:uncharacterized protein n=1 Tax=Petromyces alliaceus TaxID=209559 RepID=UPI0012A5E2C3|nr:uncharacterized protein BDW43DRAFT_285837 [Aspergillus alliaceus]KAB8230367.1 hypothetical protein BDW43DRAFT_285837 [Aspergillus alliaceus]